MQKSQQQHRLNLEVHIIYQEGLWPSDGLTRPTNERSITDHVDYTVSVFKLYSLIN